MEQKYTLWRGDNDIWLLMAVDGTPVKAGNMRAIAECLVRADKGPAEALGTVGVLRTSPVNEQRPVHPATQGA